MFTNTLGPSSHSGFLAAGAVLLILTGCNDHPRSRASSAELPLARVDRTAAASTISGRVIFSGKRPARSPIDMSAVPACERQHRTPALSEQVVVNANGTLRNTFIWVKTGLPNVRWEAPATPVRLDQQGCVYTPHVLGIMTGQALEISNSDPLNHNVHAEAAVNAGWNESQPPRAEEKIKRFDKQEILFPVTCGVHPWMRGYIGVVNHPFFAVTGDDGTFTIQGLPSGTYIVEAVHEFYGRKETSIAVGPSARKEIEFTYAGG